MSPEELSKAQVRMMAMQAAIALYCCHRNAGSSTGGGEGVNIEQFDALLPLLMQLRDKLLAKALEPGPI